MADFKGAKQLDKFVSACENDYQLPEKIETLSQNILSLDINQPTKSLSCRLCGIDEFENLAEFKTHRQSKEHLSLLTAAIDDSDSKSEYFDSDNESQKIGSPFITIKHNNLAITLYKSLIATKKEAIYGQPSASLDCEIFNRLRRLSKSNILIALNGGGYFAAGVFSLPRQQLICSKTFKRYTSRRKQGGTQSSKDNAASGNIHSAGAIIRRENEKKLREEIARLLDKWDQEGMQPVQIFCNRDSYLLDVLSKYGTITTLPFTTYQACFEEICRCFNELFTINLE